MRAMVLDDDPVFLAVADGVLRSLGVDDVSTELDATSAMMTLEEVDQDFDLILLDLNMPQMDGLATLRSLSDADYDGNIVVISGERDSILSSACHIAGRLGLKICGVIKKPIQMDLLKDAIEAAKSGSTPMPFGRSSIQPIPDGPLLPALHYQSQVDIINNTTFAAEGLLRSTTREGLLLGPEAILQDHQSSTRRLELTIELFSCLSADLKRLQDAGRPQRLSLNVDASVLEENDFVAKIKQTVDRHGVDTRGITLEVTESQLPEDATLMFEVIARLGIAGFDISMDDFGTGASNFELLRNGAFNELKLDRSTVQNANHDEVSLDFIKYTIDMAKSLDLRVIAEGVEKKDELDLLMSLGVRYVQGFLLSKPKPINQFVNDLEAEDSQNRVAS